MKAGRIDWCSAGFPDEPIARRDRHWVFVDLETEGLDPCRHRVLEWAALVLNDSGGIEMEAAWTHEDAADPGPAVAAVSRYLDRGTLVSHNVAFDLGFLREWDVARTTLFAHPERWLCTWGLSGHISLSSWAGQFGVLPVNPHTARGDVITLTRAFVETANATRRLGGTQIRDLALPWRRTTNIAQDGVTGWDAVHSAIDRVVPVHPATAEQRLVFQSVIREHAVRGPRDPAAVTEIAHRMAGAGISQILLERLLAEHGIGTDG